MSGILFLNHGDFEIRKGDKGDMMTLKYDRTGLTLVLFYSKELPTCAHLMTRFKQLPSLINGCNFAMVNMNKNMELVQMSRNTIAPITYVPDLTLFVNGCPFIRYDGEQEIDAIRKFLEDIYEKIQKLQFSPAASSTPPSLPPAHARTPDQVEFRSDPRSGHPLTQPINQFYPPSGASAGFNEGMGAPPFQPQAQHPASPRPSPPVPPAPTPAPVIPAYTVGMPKSGDPKKSYKTFDTAYATTRA